MKIREIHEVFPLEIDISFKCKIISSELIKKNSHKSYYNCSTNFGKMTLIIQEINSYFFESEIGKNAICKDKISPETFLQKRKALLSKNYIKQNNPLIYQQHIVVTHKNRSTCLTLIQPVQIVQFEQFGQKIMLQYEKNIILQLINLQFYQQQFVYCLNVFKIKQLTFLKSELTNQLFLDFTNLQYTSDWNQTKKDRSNQIYDFFSQVQFEMEERASNFEQINEIIIIKDRLFRFGKELFSKEKICSWLQVGIVFNFLRDKEVIVKVKQKNKEGELIQKDKKMQIKDLTNQGQQIITFCSASSTQVFSKFRFYDGYCINILQQINYEELLKYFFVDNSTYILKKNVYLSVQIVNNSNKTFFVKGQQKSDIIFIQKGVAKYQCINFFITYFKFIDPTLKIITFNKIQNSLRFNFFGKYNVQRQLILIFYDQYLIKDQDLSMIIQKSKLQQTKLNLSQMQITDSFLMFLANSQKMKKITHLDVSYCKRITQNGVNSLLISPFCKNLEVLNISGAPIMESSIQSLLIKTKLKELYMNNCPKYEDNNQQFILKNLKLIRLQALGVKVQTYFAQNIQYLKINSQISVEFLREIKDFSLKQLTLKLIQGKKNIIGGFLGSFYAKQINPIKLFAEGKSKNSLKTINFSGSTVKLKSLKSIFNMPSLQKIILDDISTQQQIDFSLFSNILQLSLRNSLISIKQLNLLLKNVKIMMRLNISFSAISKNQIIQFVPQSKRYINTLTISEQQYSQNLINTNGKCSQFIETFEIVVNQYILKGKDNKLIKNLMNNFWKGTKTIKFLQENREVLLEKERVKFENDLINLILKHSNISLQKMLVSEMNETLMRNVFINDKSFNKVWLQFKQRKNQQKKNNCYQFLVVHKRFKKPKVVYLNQSEFLHKKSNKKTNRTLQNDDYNSITYLMYLFKRQIGEDQQQAVQISLQHNKLIDCKSVLEMINKYFPSQHIKSIDMRGSVLYYPNILQQVIELPFLDSFNHNQYDIIFQQQNFIHLSQKYLKFFMKIHHIKKLRISCKSIHQVDILFSILYHILDYHFQTIQDLSCNFQNIKINSENSSSFWTKLCYLKKLKHLNLKFKSCYTKFIKYIFNDHQLNFQNSLEKLHIQGMNFESIPILNSGNNIKDLSLSFQNSEINQLSAQKILRPYGQNLKRLSLNFSQCANIACPQKILSKIINFTKLEYINLQFQYCQIKELSTLDFLQSIYLLKTLKEVQINLSFTSILYNVIAGIIQNYKLKLPKCRFIIYLIGNDKKDKILQLQDIDSQGIQIIR